MCKKDKKVISCPHCDGTGQDKYNDGEFTTYSEYENCHFCGGLGYLVENREEIEGEILTVFSPCDYCIAREQRYTHPLCIECIGNPEFDKDNM